MNSVLSNDMTSWNNDLFYFDTTTSKYFKIKDVGSRPSPRAAFGYAQTADVGFIFGGRCASGRQNDFHRLDFETRPDHRKIYRADEAGYHWFITII